VGTVSDDCAAVRLSLGVYVLGALDPGERAVTEAHLATCQACRDELVHLAGLPGLLGRLSLADMTTDAADDVTSGMNVSGATNPGVNPGAEIEGVASGGNAVERAVAELARRRRATRRRLAVAAAALVIAVAGVSVGVTAAATTSADGPKGRMLSATDARTNVAATVWVADDPTGSAFTVRLRGVEPSTHCALVAVATDGRRETAASWVANYYGGVDVRGASGIRANRLAKLLVVSDSGEELVALPLPSSPG
jgi:predicted anti-sigma-YlaC factor YlaD